MEVLHQDFVHALRKQAAAYPDRIAYTFIEDGDKKESYVTYAELDIRTRKLAIKLQSELETGDRVLLLYPPSLDYVIAFYACLYAGVIPVPAYPPDTRNMSRLESIIEDAGATAALSIASIIVNVQTGSLSKSSSAEYLQNRIKWLATDDISQLDENNWSAPNINPEDVAFLQYTSGSTGKPKGVIVTHDNLVYNSALIKDACGHKSDDGIVSWLPPYHDMGLIAGILQGVYAGIPVTLMSPMTFLKRPIKWLSAISAMPIKGKVTGGAPNFAFEQCVEKITEEQMAGLDLKKWQLVYTGAEPVRAETLKKFSAKFSAIGFDFRSFYPVYGLAEATLLSSAGDRLQLPVFTDFDAEEMGKNRMIKASSSDKYYTLVGCGGDLEGQKILIVNPDTLQMCKPTEIGEIWLSGRSIAKGYWNNPSETEKTFNAYTADSKEGPFMRTGDLGILLDNQLYVTGRIKDLIIIRGSNHYPQDIEESVENSNDVLRPGCGAAFSVDAEGEEKLVIVQEVKRQYANKFDAAKVIADIVKTVSLKHSLQIHEIVLIEPSSFPKTSSGKLQRRAAKKMYEEKTLEVLTWHNCKAAQAGIII